MFLMMSAPFTSTEKLYDRMYSMYYNIKHENCIEFLKALSHDAIFLATCNAILLLGDAKLANASFHQSLLIYF